jgi:hypothetical protein
MKLEEPPVVTIDGIELTGDQRNALANALLNYVPMGPMLVHHNAVLKLLGLAAHEPPASGPN